ncbi:LysR family transcriptional regulator [Sporolactobacillus pectinivorans]|uniref:LysR family transcriptional regulator n=1 Tax=Sporolactobacillus pectinivorans TaxID=1591408 RepID=UPI000C26780E|nr:LysR family transcriptional regulator [Sporolactobacillus pectinivorans]
MELSDLRIFQAVARSQSFSKAAESLGYVQPNVTLRIKKLENDLNVPLFRRTNRGVETLPSALTLLTYADRILSLMDEAEEKLTSRAFLSVGATPILSAQLFPAFIQKVHLHFPQVKVEVKTDQKVQLYSDLKHDLIDGIFVNEKAIPDGLTSIFSYTEKLFLVSARTEPDSGDERIAVVNKNPQCPYRNMLLHYLDNKMDTTDIIEYDTLEPIIRSVESTNAVTILPQSLVTSKMSKASLPKEMNSIRIHFVVKQANVKKKTVKKIIETLSE